MSKKYIIVSFVFIIPVLLISVKLAEANRWAKDGLIHPRVYINGISVGGMTKEEVDYILSSKYQSVLDENIIRFTHDKKELAQLPFSAIQARYDFTDILETAWQYGRNRGSFIRAFLSPKPYEINQPPQYHFNAEALEKYINQLCDKINADPFNATFEYKSGQVEAVPGKHGRKIDTQSVMALTRRLVSGQSSGEVKLQIVSVKPVYTSSDLTFPLSCLGSFTTVSQNPADNARLANIQIASNRIHNQTIYPGEIFSASYLIASHIPNSGYAKSIVLVDGLPVEDVGGGVCQVVTTLYNAVLHAELPVVERHNHSSKVGYVDYGFDATIAGDYYDFKFKNNTAYPLLITSDLQDNQLTVSLHGYEKRPSGRTVSFEAALLEVLPTPSLAFKQDASIPKGERWITTIPQDGYKYELYKCIYENGALKEKEKVNSSTYKPVQGVVATGEGVVA